MERQRQKKVDSDKDATADSLLLAVSQGNKQLVEDCMSRMAEAFSGNAS